MTFMNIIGITAAVFLVFFIFGLTVDIVQTIARKKNRRGR